MIFMDDDPTMDLLRWLARVILSGGTVFHNKAKQSLNEGVS